MKLWYLIVGSAVLMLAACCQGRLESVLAYSGENRRELERVLEHYETVDRDSLKLEAARFLIENMPGHYYADGPVMRKWRAQLDTLGKAACHVKKMLETIPFHYANLREEMILCEDVKCLTADYLISRIDQAFEQWRNSPWLAEVGYETFRDYLLPYRVENELPDYWRDSTAVFLERLSEVQTWFDDGRHGMAAFARLFFSLNNNLQLHQIVPDYKDYNYDCISTAQIELFAMRILGVPAAIDFTPCFANRNSRHYWMQPIDGQVNNADCFQLKLNTIGKVYRRTYAHNPTPEYNGREYVPPFFLDPFNRDVTSLYLRTSDVDFRLDKAIHQRYVYLAVFNDLEWKPIAWGKREGNEVAFRDMGKNVVYLPVCFEADGTMTAVASPFVLYNDGRVHTLETEKDSSLTLVLGRKYSLFSQADIWTAGLIGSRFECADTPDFKQADTVHVISAQPEPGYHEINVEERYRKKKYWRFVPGSRDCWLAEMTLFNPMGNSMSMNVVADEKGTYEELLDNAPLTYLGVRENLEWSLVEGQELCKIRYLGRNDDNNIFPGDLYELFYYHFPEGWISLGKQQAQREFLIYEQVPAGGLYWLRDLTKGREERIFTWENGRMNFW